ncbi:MAG: Crp/Fnr family transcriptional regulator [bacterium]|nr:Crp/Fnr family transcriptional regulator [bacterium]
MFIDSDILITWGGIAKKYKKGEFIFHEGEHARFFHQIISGTIKMFNTNYDGKEFTQAEFGTGESFGEPPLFIDETYPSTAVATHDSVIIKVSKEKLFEILDEYPAIERKIITVLARRIYNKSITASEVINNSPETRILAFLNAYKKKIECVDKQLEIPYTRQEIANYTGLRVETVIRTLIKMQTKNLVKIVNRKLVY